MPVRASEIGEFVYCHRAWWLRHVRGYTSAHHREMADGLAVHTAHGRGVMWGRAAQRLAWVLALGAALVLALTWGR